jgi:predicted anti-sigma-YlaC factor YlaD
MSDADNIQRACPSEEIAAYLDGELNAPTAALFEQHLKECADCAAELLQQRRLLCTLDFALGGHDDGSIALPKNFSQVVAAHAQSDLRSLRHERAEHGRALRLCLLLGIIAFALLGGAAVSESVLKPVGVLLRHAGTVLGFMGRALYDFGAGLAVIARAVGGHTVFESNRLNPFIFLLLAILVVLLPRLISSYHRTHISLEEAAPRR